MKINRTNDFDLTKKIGQMEDDIMKRISQLTIVALCMLFITDLLFADEIPMTISYQGKLTDSLGVPINEDVTMEFRIFDVKTGGDYLWTETQTITVIKGLYNVEIGSESSGIDLPFDEAYWLEVAIDGVPFTTRQKITGVGYSMNLAPGANVPGDLYVDGNVGVGTTDPRATLMVSAPSPIIRIDDITPDADIGFNAWNNDGFVLFRKNTSVTDVRQGLHAQGDGGQFIGGIEFIQGNVEMYPQGEIGFYTTSSGNEGAEERMRITHNGNVGIGTTEPNALIHTESSSEQYTARFVNNNTGPTYGSFVYI